MKKILLDKLYRKNQIMNIFSVNSKKPKIKWKNLNKKQNLFKELNQVRFQVNFYKKNLMPANLKSKLLTKKNMLKKNPNINIKA